MRSKKPGKGKALLERGKAVLERRKPTGE